MSKLFYKFNPHKIIPAIFFRWAVTNSGMKIRFVSIDNNSIRLAYGEKGTRNPKQSSILLLHGLSADKFMWAPLVKVS